MNGKLPFFRINPNETKMSKRLNELNPAQLKAVKHENGPLLIIAGPGSGKTRTIACSIAYAIEEGVLPDRILAFSFTVKASKDLKNRVKEIVEEKGNLVNISTFHSFCRRVLREDIGKLRREGTINFGDLGEDEQEREDRKIVVRAINHLQYHKFVKPKDVLDFIIKCKARGIQPSDSGSYTTDSYKSEAYVKIYEEYERYLKTHGWIDYENQQLFTDQLFKEDAEVRAKWQGKFELIFVDEFQDTDPIQYEIIKSLAGEHQNLRVVGDDDQGIYGWRGSDIQNILNFKNDYSIDDDDLITLGENYRSTQNIVEASRALAEFNPDRREKDLFTRKSKNTDPKVIHLHCEDANVEANTIADFIDRAIKDGREPKDFAIFCRSTKSQSPVFEEAFKNSGIPHHVVEDLSILQCQNPAPLGRGCRHCLRFSLETSCKICYNI